MSQRKEFFSKFRKGPLPFITSVTLLAIIMIHPVNPAGSTPGVLYVNPANVPTQAIGSTFAVQFKVAGMDQFNGWDIQVASDQGIINATSISISGNIFDANTTGGSAFEIVHCVNGKGTGCTSTDGPGNVHSAYVNSAFASGSGLLFTITFRVLGMPFANLFLRIDLISSSNPSGVPHATEYGSYGFLVRAGGGGSHAVQM